MHEHLEIHIQDPGSHGFGGRHGFIFAGQNLPVRNLLWRAANASSKAGRIVLLMVFHHFPTNFHPVYHHQSSIFRYFPPDFPSNVFITNQPLSSFSIQSSIQWSSSTDHVPIFSIYFSSSLPSSANHFPYFPSKSSHFTTTNQPSLTPQCASRHSRVHFFDGLVAKSAPNLKRF